MALAKGVNMKSNRDIIIRTAKQAIHEHEKTHGRPRSKSWDGRKSHRQDRKISKRNLKKEIGD